MYNLSVKVFKKTTETLYVSKVSVVLLDYGRFRNRRLQNH